MARGGEVQERRLPRPEIRRASFVWCRGPDLNRQAVRRRILSPNLLYGHTIEHGSRTLDQGLAGCRNTVIVNSVLDTLSEKCTPHALLIDIPIVFPTSRTCLVLVSLNLDKSQRLGGGFFKRRKKEFGIRQGLIINRQQPRAQ
jgi:hypothetical protein